jgi:hypothetical protein
MTKKLNLTGQRFGRLKVIKEGDPLIKKSHRTRARWLCQCDCGNVSLVRSDCLKNKNTQSCGCYGKSFHIKHHLFNHPIYTVWDGIKSRCHNQKAANFKRYGGRGIKICDEWKDDFKAFYDWCILSGWEKGLEIDRFPDNNGNYEPSNCRIVTRRLNALNKTELQSNNTSGYAGVYFSNSRNKWNSAIKVNGKVIYINSCDSKKQAVRARNSFIIQNNLEHEYKIQEWME